MCNRTILLSSYETNEAIPRIKIEIWTRVTQSSSSSFFLKIVRSSSQLGRIARNIEPWGNTINRSKKFSFQTIKLSIIFVKKHIRSTYGESHIYRIWNLQVLEKIPKYLRFISKIRFFFKIPSNYRNSNFSHFPSSHVSLSIVSFFFFLFVNRIYTRTFPIHKGASSSNWMATNDKPLAATSRRMGPRSSITFTDTNG